MAKESQLWYYPHLPYFWERGNRIDKTHTKSFLPYDYWIQFLKLILKQLQIAPFPV